MNMYQESIDAATILYKRCNVGKPDPSLEHLVEFLVGCGTIVMCTGCGYGERSRHLRDDMCIDCWKKKAEAGKKIGKE